MFPVSHYFFISPFFLYFRSIELVQLPIYLSPGFRVPQEEGVRVAHPQAHRHLGHLRPCPQAYHMRRGNKHETRTS